MHPALCAQVQTQEEFSQQTEQAMAVAPMDEKLQGTGANEPSIQWAPQVAN